MENVTNEKLDAIQKRLRKLQKMYEGAKAINSEGEAQAAAAAIQRILLEYNITIEEVGVDKEKDSIEQETCSGFTYKSIGGWWETRLVNVLCKFNFCRCYCSGHSYHTLFIVGTEENRKQVRWFREFLSEKFVELSKKSYKEYLDRFISDPWNHGLKPMSKDKYQRSFLVGCAIGLERKLEEERERDKQDVEIGGKVTALVLRKDQELQQWVDKNYGKTGTTRMQQKYDEARSAGIKAGRETSLARPISGHQAAAEAIKVLG